MEHIVMVCMVGASLNLS